MTFIINIKNEVYLLYYGLYMYSTHHRVFDLPTNPNIKHIFFPLQLTKYFLQAFRELIHSCNYCHIASVFSWSYSQAQFTSPGINE